MPKCPVALELHSFSFIPHFLQACVFFGLCIVTGKLCACANAIKSKSGGQGKSPPTAAGKTEQKAALKCRKILCEKSVWMGG